MRSRNLWEAFKEWRDELAQRSPTGAETFEAAEDRAMSLLTDVIALRSPVVLLVSHGHFSRIFLPHCVLGSTAAFHRRMRFDNGHFADIRIEEGRPRLVAFNALTLSHSRSALALRRDHR